MDIPTRVLAPLAQTEMDGNDTEREVYKVVNMVHDQRPELTEQILWATSKHIAGVMEQRKKFQHVTLKQKKLSAALATPFPSGLSRWPC
jgi:hypothetical protein